MFFHPHIQGKEELVGTTNFTPHMHELITNYGCQLYSFHHMLKKCIKQL